MSSLDLTWKKLIEVTDEVVWRGTIFRFPGKYPYEDIVDFMLIEDLYSDSGFSFITTTGFKAGIYARGMPKEALAINGAGGIERTWLIKNWVEWVYSETPISDVLVCINYPAPDANNS